MENINKNQKIWLTDRFLTYQYLNKLPYGNFNILKNQVSDDIQNIEQIKDGEELKSNKNISLKQAYDLYKKMTKFQDGINKISKGDLTDENSIKALITSFSFIFNIKKNKTQYEKDSFKEMQSAFWQTVIEAGGKYAEFPISAYFLQYSLEKDPQDLFITEEKIIKEIKEDRNFKENINNKWNLNVKLHDRYDYSKTKELMQYYDDTSSVAKSLLSSTLYNLASFSVKCNVMKEYDIDIQIHLEEFEVKWNG